MLVLYDGPDEIKNPAKLDALYLANLLGHFTTKREVIPLEDYEPGQWKKYDAVFSIVYQKKYVVPAKFLRDVPSITKPFCWLGNQSGQLGRNNFLRSHGLQFDRFFENSPAERVSYKGQSVGKGDPDTNLFKIIDPSKVQMVAEAQGKNGFAAPYILHSGNFWVVTDSPFSYLTENDRYLVFADVLHDILGVQHAEKHSAMLRVEDINALTEPDDLKSTLRVIRSHNIPFAFGYVPFYVDPTRRIFEELSEKPGVVDALQKYIKYRGQPVLHGDTHQYRGVTTDDYEFWDDISDRPVKRDSETFAFRKVEEALKESVACGIYPLTWETPHYAASAADYHVFRRIFQTVFERRQTGPALGTDQYFPYPVIDLYGQYVIPENMGYVEKENPTSAIILANAQAAYVVRDGYASFFFHPFMKPKILDELISGIEKMGFKFVGLPSFPNTVRGRGYLATNEEGLYTLEGEGRFLTEIVMSENGQIKSTKTNEVPNNGKIEIPVSLGPLETFVAYRHSFKPSGFIEKMLRLAKGDLSVFNRKLEGMLPVNEMSDTMKVKLLWNENAKGEEEVDQNSFEAMLQSIGYDIGKIETRSILEQELGKFSLLVIPAAAARQLNDDAIDRICKAVEGGIILVTDGETPLSKALGFDIGGKVRVSDLENHLFSSLELRWPDKPMAPWIDHLSDTNDVVYYSEREGRKPLVVGRTIGEGRVLYLAPYFDSLSGKGYSRFTDLPYMLLSEFHVHPLLKRYGAEAYFDPGYRQKISIELLAKYWKRFGIRTVYVGAWHFYDKYTYDYERLIKVAHQNGILVYAWFEWPHVSQQFWDQHPEWREKNAFLADAHLDWRYLMNFQNSDCFNAVMKDAARLLTKLDWDGVNVAEFHFESDQMASRYNFTPLNAQSRASFQKAYGFDPLDLWKSGSPNQFSVNPKGMADFFDFRKALNSLLLGKVIKKIQAIPVFQQRRMELVVTVFDVFGHPELSNRLGIDGDKTISLINRTDSTLQVEDPASDWSKPPVRYEIMGDRYRKMNLKNPFMIDINILAVHPSDQIGFTADVPSGTEVLQLFQAAAKHTPRVCLYSESTIAESDWELFPYAMAADASAERRGDEWLVDAPETVQLELNRPLKRVSMDDRPWLCYDKGAVIIPAGKHRITVPSSSRTLIDTSQLDTRLLSISGELMGSEQKHYGLEVEYTSPGRCAIMFNRSPYATFLDGTAARLETLKGDEGYTVIGPPGQHRIRVISGSIFLHILEYTSVVSASLIVLFGTASSGLLILLFIFIKIHRQTQPVQQRIFNRMFGIKKKAK